MKRDNWEGGHRVPFLVRWPGEIAAGASSDQLICLTDVMATLADVAGVSLPDEAAEDSASLLGVWRGEQQEPVHDYVIHQGFGGDRYLAIRQGDWKLLAHQGSGGNTYDRHPRLKAYQLPDDAPQAAGQLYNLANDPDEAHNLYDAHPEQAAALERLLKESLASGRSVPSR
jgi:arylsulfatase A-like enzyme